MHQAVTNLTTATDFFFTDTDEFLSHTNPTHQSQAPDNLDWFPTDHFQEPEDWYLHPTSDETTKSRGSTIHPTTLPKFTFPGMHTRNIHPGTNTSDRSATAINNNRWRFNGTGQLVDSEAASAGWVAEELGRLKIGDVSVDASEEPHNAIQTPPKVAATSVVQLNEAQDSPLETSSDVSGDSSPHTSDHQIPTSHARGSSTDTTVSTSQESAVSSSSQTLLAPAHSSLKVVSTGEVKERPHSFSGGLSSADLKRLQQAGDGIESHLPNGDTSIADKGMLQQQWSAVQHRDTGNFNEKHYTPEQLVYPSLAAYSVNAPRPQLQQYEYRPSPTAATITQDSQRDEQVDYNLQQRNLNHVLQTPPNGAGNVPSFVQTRLNNPVEAVPFRQPLRGFGQQGLVSNSAALGYTGGHHTTHLSLGNTQQLYDMMLSGAESHHPAVTRVQQQHNVFRATHHHSASDPSNMRDAATLTMLSNNMPPFGPGLYPSAMTAPMPLYASQFYGAQDAYSHPDVATQVMAARLQAQYTGPYSTVPDQSIATERGMTSPTNSQNGPSANNRKLGLYKTELCRSWEEKGSCRYGAKCQFAHGEEELRKVTRHPKYKTEICRTFWVSGSCPYGKRCCFIHTELPTTGGAGATAGTENASPTPASDGRARSLSTNSDPNDASISLLARISAKRGHEVSVGSNGSTPMDASPPSNLQFNARPPTGSLRVDTSALDNPVIKQNKSAYPSFASNGVLLPTADSGSVQSPIPVTAGPDLGRHNSSRMEIVGYNQQRLSKATTNPNVRHSFSGTEVDLNLNTSSPSVSGPSSSYGMSSATDGGSNTSTSANLQVTRPSGHIRSGSAGNWGSLSRNNHLAPSPFPQSSSPAGEVNVHAPWSTTELAVGSSRLHETWT